MDSKPTAALPRRPPEARPEREAFSALQRSILEEFERFARGFGLGLEWTPLLGAAPLMNVSEQDGIVHVEADLPGLGAADVEVLVDGDLLTLRGERKPPKEDRARSTFRRERQVGPFERTVRLPSAVQAERAAAVFESGVLKIDLPVRPTPPRNAYKVPIASN